MHVSQSLVKSLEGVLGRHSAFQELKWMKEALMTPPVEDLDRAARSIILRQQWEALPDLETMVRRRLVGEPLQYILGTSSSICHSEKCVETDVCSPVALAYIFS